MKPKKSLSLIVILSFLFIANLVMFSIIQRPLYAWPPEGCDGEECDPSFLCERLVQSYCNWVCDKMGAACESIELEGTPYCAPGVWFPCECFSIWNVNCTDQTSFFYFCNEQTFECAFPQK